MTPATSAQLAAAPSPDEGSLYERKPAKRNFSSRRGELKLAPEQAVRQGRAVTVALRAFSSSAAAMVFLNTEQPHLGRPLDLAVSSDSGLAAVEAALERLQAATG